MQNLGQRLFRFRFMQCCVALAGLLACLCANVGYGAEADSGWAISTSPTLEPQVQQSFPSARSSVRQLLNVKEPLIRIEPSRVETQASKRLASRPLSSLRIAERPDWQPSRPVRRESSITLNWEASKLSDFDLGDAPARPATELNEIELNEIAVDDGASDEAAQAVDDATAVKFANEEPSAPKSVQKPVANTPPSDTPMALDASESSLDIIIEPDADLHESFKSSPRIAKPQLSEPQFSKPQHSKPLPAKEPQQAKQATEKILVKPAPVRKPAVKQSNAAPTSTQPKVGHPPQPVAKPLPPLSRNQIRLRGKMQHVLKSYYRRPLNSRDHDPWEIMHGMLAYGVYSRVLQNSPQGDPITAVGWLCYNKPSKKKTLLYVDKQGELRARWGVGVQGHYGQFLAMLAQCRVDKSYPIRVGAEEFTVEDLIAAEKKTCQAGEELSFKLIALMHYCPSDTKWMNEQGSEWGIPKLIHEELKQSIRGAPCGGTHRLSGLSLAVRTRIKRGEPVDGEYRRAQEFVERYERYALQFQNSDGSLSTEWFRGRGDDDDINRRIKTTGHLLEWLLYSQTDDEIQSSRTFNAVNYLTNLMASNYSQDWEIGPLAHAIHALVLYDERVFQPHGEPETVKRSRPIASKQRQPQRQQRQRRKNVSTKSKRRR